MYANCKRLQTFFLFLYFNDVDRLFQQCEDSSFVQGHSNIVGNEQFATHMLVGWVINVPFQHKKIGYIGDKVLGGDLVFPG